MAKPLLELETLTERPVVVIKSGTGRARKAEQFEMISPAEFSLVDEHRFGRLAQRFSAIYQQDQDLSEEAAAELGRILDESVRLVLRAPEEVHARLTDRHRALIFQAFSQLTGTTTASPASANAEAGRSTGESGSPA